MSQPAAERAQARGARIRVIDRPRKLPVPKTVTPCTECGSVMLPAQRFEATQTIDVLICWDCGKEDPPYRTVGRLIANPPPRRKTCAWCGESFDLGRFLTPEQQRACSFDCADKLAAFTDSGRRRAADGR